MMIDNNLPLVSFVIPSYNASTFLRSALNSCVTQTYPNIEIILVDDGSTDNTREIVEEFLHLKKFRYIKNEQNKGLIFSLNRGIESASGDIIARMDADDISLPHRIEKQVEILLKNPEVEVVGSDVILIDEHDRPMGKPRVLLQSAEEIEWAVVTSCPLHHPTAMLKNKSYYKVEERHVEDLGLWSRILLSGKKIVIVDEPLLLYRKHKSSITASHGHFQSHASADLGSLFAKSKWNLDLSSHFLLAMRLRNNLSDRTVFLEAKNVIDNLNNHEYPEMAKVVSTYVQLTCLNTIFFFSRMEEKNKWRAVANSFRFIFSRGCIKTLPLAVGQFISGLKRKVLV